MPMIPIGGRPLLRHVMKYSVEPLFVQPIR